MPASYSAPQTVVDRMHGEFQAILRFLDGSGEISLVNTVNDNFRKSILLCAASYFENVIGDYVVQFTEDCSPSAKGLVSALVRNKALSRQYHTWFAWDSNNANQFFALFGDQFRKFMGSRIAGEPKLRDAISAFIEIGRERNRLVH
jgi:RiboL-PSP-HEPN